MKLDTHNEKSTTSQQSSAGDKKWRVFGIVVLFLVIITMNTFGIYFLKLELRYHVDSMQAKHRREIEILIQKCNHMHAELTKLRDLELPNKLLTVKQQNLDEEAQHAMQTEELQTLTNNLLKTFTQIADTKDERIHDMLKDDLTATRSSIRNLHEKMNNNSISVAILEAGMINLMEEIEFTRAEVAFVVAPVLKQAGCLYAPEFAEVKEKTMTLNYDPGVNCLYTIRAPQNSRIKYWFDAFETENGPDYVEIMDGQHIVTYFGNTSLHSKILRILRPQVSQRNVVHLRFVTDNNVEKKDLKLRFKLE